jgi:hypothetical protein
MLGGRWRVIVGLTVLLLAALVLAAPAWADRAFKPRFTANASGDIAVIGNTLETCQSAAAGCDHARDATGSTLNNNGFTMERVDVDSDATTFDSSSAQLTLPDGARVLFAGSTTALARPRARGPGLLPTRL